MSQVERPVAKTDAGDVVVPLPGDVVKAVVEGEESTTHYYGIVVGSVYKPGSANFQIDIVDPRYSKDRVLLMYINKWNSWLWDRKHRCTVEICRRIRLVLLPRKDPIEIDVDW